MNMLRLATLLSLAFLLVAGGCTKKSEPPPTPAGVAAATGATGPTGTASATAGAPTSAPAVVAAAPDLTADANGLSKAVVVMKTSKGTIKFRLYPNDAPVSTKRFAELVRSKFYDGLAFHRVVPGFVVQSGDPKSRNKSDPTVGTGGSGQKLKAEFNRRHHVRGTVAMARAADPDSADSQFYVCLNTFEHLNNQYTVIGQTIDFGEKVGEKDVLDRITQWDEIVDMRIE